MDKYDIRNLKKRYLIWLYKTAKEELDKIERKFTQLDIDKFMLKELKRSGKDKKTASFIQDFRIYIQNKEKNSINLKYKGKNLRPNYLFLTLKLKAIEKAGLKILGKKGLDEVKSLYEKEMVERILKSREH